MKHLTPQIIADITGGEYIGREQDRYVKVQGAARDNRDVRPGNLFLCIPGARVDGHSFADNAFERGAACAVAQHALGGAKGPYVIVESTLEAVKKLGAYYRRLFDIPVIGITGSVGKTTVKEMVACALGARFCVLKTPENLNNELGVPLVLLSLEPRHEAAVIEMGASEFGEMGRLAQMVRPDICVTTKIGHAHLDALGDLDGVLRAKSEVFAHMQYSGISVLNGDDEMLLRFDPGLRKITFGLGAGNDFRAENIQSRGVEAVTFDVVSAEERFPVEISAFGEHVAQMALPAAVVGFLLGMSGAEIARGLRSYTPVDGRANVRDTGFVTLIDDCYNANPSSVAAALRSLAGLSGRRVAILGDMNELGGQSEKLHREIGALAANLGIDLLLCGGEKAEAICNGYISAGGRSAKHFAGRAELIAALPELIEKGDIVLVKASNSMRFDEIASWF